VTNDTDRVRARALLRARRTLTTVDGFLMHHPLLVEDAEALVASEKRVAELEEALRQITEYPTADGIAMSAIARLTLEAKP
jgi:hypothetical protein